MLQISQSILLHSGTSFLQNLVQNLIDLVLVI